MGGSTRRRGARRWRSGGAGLLALALVPGVFAVPALARTDPAAPIRTVERRTVVELPFRTLYRDSKDLQPGVERVVSPGRTGLAARTSRLTFEGSRLVARSATVTDMLRPAEDRVVLQEAWPGVAGPVVRECGLAAWSPGSGPVARHRFLPMGTEVTVTAARSGRQVTVVINGRGPFVAGR